MAAVARVRAAGTGGGAKGEEGGGGGGSRSELGAAKGSCYPATFPLALPPPSPLPYPPSLCSERAFIWKEVKFQLDSNWIPGTLQLNFKPTLF